MGFKAWLMPPAIVANVTPPPPATYPEAVAAVGTPILWYKFQGTSGTVAENSGSLGSGWDAAFADTVWTLGNTGLIGSNDAIRSVISGGSILKNPASPTQTNSVLTFAHLVFAPSNPLVSSASQYGVGGSERLLLTVATNGTLSLVITTPAGSSTKTTSTTIPLNQWFWVFSRWNGATGATDLRLGYGGGLVTPVLTVDTDAAAGSFEANYVILAYARANTLFDETIIWNAVATDTQLLDIVTLSGA